MAAGWGVDGNLRERAEILLRSLPKDYRRACQPIGPVADGFADLWCRAPKDMPLFQACPNMCGSAPARGCPTDAYDNSRCRRTW
jgi:ATP-dependent helicase HrpA